MVKQCTWGYDSWNDVMACMVCVSCDMIKHDQPHHCDTGCSASAARASSRYRIQDGQSSQDPEEHQDPNFAPRWNC